MHLDPFLRLRPHRHGPLILTCEHASRRLPPGAARDEASREVLSTHWGWDPGAWEVTRRLSDALDASAVGGRWSRLWLDLNRPVGDPTLIRPEAEGVALPWNRDLGPLEVERRLLQVHVPYHAEIDRLVLRRLVRGARPLLLAVHSFTPELGGERRDFDAGVLFTEHEELGRKLAGGLEAGGYDVRHNEPYSGLQGMMYAAERHGSHHRIPCLELELNQGRLEDPEWLADTSRRLAEVLADLLEGLDSGTPASRG